MAEVVGLVASIIGISQLAAKVTSLGYGYVGGVKRAPEDIQNFMKELGSLTRVLTTLEGCAKTHPGSPALEEIENPLQECLQEMEKLVTKMQPKGWWKKKVARFKWPLKETETAEYIGRLERHKSFFIIALNADQLSRTKAVESHVQEIKADIKDLKATAVQDSSRWKRKEILNWLSPDAFDTKHQDISNRRQESTGNWLLRRPEVLDWIKKNPNSPLLWGYGIPGAGKTFLCSRVIDHLLSQAQAASYGLAYIYFDYKERDQQKPIRILASLIKQLVCQIQHLDLPTELMALHSRCNGGQRKPTFHELYTILLDVIKSGGFAQTFIICDALDECDQKTQRKKLLPLFHQMGKDGMNVFLTSREYPEDIQDSLGNSAKVQLWAQEEDITHYIEQKINDSPRAKRLVSLGNCKDKIISELTDCAKGMFLLVHFHIEYLCQQTTVREILTELERLKTSSSEEEDSPLRPTYDRAMEILRGQSKSCVLLALKILSWLVKARRTLTVRELQQAVSVEEDRTALDEWDLPDRKTLLEVCASLVTVDEKSDTIKLAHYTVQEYLVQTSTIPGDADFRITMACTTFLSFDVFAQGTCTSKDSLQARHSLHPFLNYAVKYLSSHSRTCDEALTARLILKFLGSPGCISSYLQVFHGGVRSTGYDQYPKGQVPLHVAAALGHCSVVRQLLKSINVMAKDSLGRTAIHEAAYYGHDKVVQLLLENGGDISAADNSGLTVLHRAASNGKASVVRMVIDQGADISAVDVDGKTALYIAACSGQGSIVQLLIDAGADPMAKDNKGYVALQIVVDSLYSESVRVLLEGGANPSVGHGGDLCMIPLSRAVALGNEPMARLLLEYGADPLIKDDIGQTALHMAIFCGESMLRMLLKLCGDTPTGEFGWTTLHYAAMFGYRWAVEILLQHHDGCWPTDFGGRTVLHCAVGGFGDSSLIQMLLESDCEEKLAARDDEGLTALHFAVSGRRPEEIFELLLEKGADPSLTDNEGMTPLQWAESHDVYPSEAMILEEALKRRVVRIVEE